MTENTEKKVILIFGKRGSGKSYLAQKLIAEYNRIIIYDTLSEYKSGVIFERYPQFLKFWKSTYHNNFRLIYRPVQPQKEMADLATLVFMIGEMTFLIEEVDNYCGPQQISDEFAHIIQRGRHKNITLIGITQRPYGINRLLTSQAKEIYIFNTNEPRDREYLRNLLGKEVETKLDQLQQYQYIKWQEGVESLEIGKA